MSNETTTAPATVKVTVEEYVKLVEDTVDLLALSGLPEVMEDDDQTTIYVEECISDGDVDGIVELPADWRNNPTAHAQIIADAIEKYFDKHYYPHGTCQDAYEVYQEQNRNYYRDLGL
jgi:hypothetical protein